MFQLLNIFQKKRPLPVGDDILKKYETPLFKDMSIQQEIAQNGFAVRNLLSDEQISALKSDFQEILQHPDNEITGLFWNSGRAKSVEVRNLAKRSIDQHIKPYLQDLFLPNKMDLMGGVFVAKPVSNQSELNPHQDSSHVEEDKFMSVYAWTTLTDVSVQNGALHVVPGSHRFGNSQRSLNVPWQLDPFVKTLWKYAIPVPMKAGQVLFFDSATIHCSPPNNGKELRLAVNFFIKPSEARFLHYYQDELTPEGMVEKFHVDMDFFYNKDFQQRPGSEYPMIGYEIYNNLQLDNATIEHWCKVSKKH